MLAKSKKQNTYNEQQKVTYKLNWAHWQLKVEKHEVKQQNFRPKLQKVQLEAE